jgi:acyl dehydratase
MANSKQASPTTVLYFDDLHVGKRFTSDTHLIDEEQIKAFAKQFDPQPFHLDAEAAKATLFEGLVASGWHTAAITMRLMVESSLSIAGGVIGAGGQIAWPKPTRPGAVLCVESEVLELKPSRSRPNRGLATIRSETRNQFGEIVQVLVAKLVVPRRPALSEHGNATKKANSAFNPDGMLPAPQTGHDKSSNITEPTTDFHDEIDDRYSVRRIAPGDAAGIDRPGESPRPAFEPSSWVAEANGEIIGSISMVTVDNETGRIEQFHVASDWEADRRLARRLARTAGDFARERGLLKLVIDVPEDLPGLPREIGLSPTARAVEAQSRVRTYFEMLGFVFSRKREVNGKTMLEFYLDLYKHPLIEPIQ